MATLPVTVSIGTAHRSPAEALDQAISRADEAVYRAKFAGPNRVFIAE